MRTRVEMMNDFLAINVVPGKTIQDIVEASGSMLPFGCRDGECGTCAVSIEQGMEYLSPVTPKEVKAIKEVLIGTGFKTEKTRLACQMKVDKPNGLVRIKF